MHYSYKSMCQAQMTQQPADALIHGLRKVLAFGFSSSNLTMKFHSVSPAFRTVLNNKPPMGPLTPLLSLPTELHLAIISKLDPLSSICLKLTNVHFYKTINLQIHELYSVQTQLHHDPNYPNGASYFACFTCSRLLHKSRFDKFWYMNAPEYVGPLTPWLARHRSCVDSGFVVAPSDRQ